MARHRDGDGLIGLCRQLDGVGLTRRVALVHGEARRSEHDAPVVVHHRHVKLRRLTRVVPARCRMRQRLGVVLIAGVLGRP